MRYLPLIRLGPFFAASTLIHPSSELTGDFAQLWVPNIPYRQNWLSLTLLTVHKKTSRDLQEKAIESTQTNIQEGQVPLGTTALERQHDTQFHDVNAILNGENRPEA